MTVASLGTIGKNASIAETAKISGYVHQAPDTHWTNWSKMFIRSEAAAAVAGAAGRHRVRLLLQRVRERIELDLAAGRVGQRVGEQPIREPRVARQQRAVQVRAVHAASAAALEARLAVVPEARDHAAERLGALVQEGAARVVLEAGQRLAGP